MEIVNPDSLSLTLDNINEALFSQKPLYRLQKERAAEWIAGRQGKPGSYANMFAPTETDYTTGAIPFTGERLKSRASIRHILGEEACRALIQLNVSDTGVRGALERASRGMLSRLGPNSGTYCCGTCTVAFWRHLVVGGLDNSQNRLETGMIFLKTRRDGKGRWRNFPFFYTLLLLSEIDSPRAVGEIQYASKVCDRYLKRTSQEDEISRRRRTLIERVLNSI